MGLMSKVFGGDKPKEDELPDVPCPHTALVPRWDNAEDMGKADKISHYFCTGCETVLSREKAAAIGSPGVFR